MQANVNPPDLLLNPGKPFAAFQQVRFQVLDVSRIERRILR